MKYTTQGMGVIRDEAGNLVGINVGWDFTAEHEWGIRGIKLKLGVNDKGYGSIRHLIRNPANIRTCEKKIGGEKWRKKVPISTWHVIFCNSRFDAADDLPTYFNEEQEIIGAWSGETGFAVGIKDKAVFDTMMKAIAAGDVLITNESLFLSEQSPFSRGGLKLLIRSALPDEWEHIWIDSHQDHEKLLKAAEKTGIEKKLRAAGKGFYALSPKWMDETRTTVQFWLNPEQQDENNFGWYSVEDLEAWIANSGPIPKTKISK